MKRPKENNQTELRAFPRYTEFANLRGLGQPRRYFSIYKDGVRACGFGTGSSSSIVAMMQPSQAFMREDATGGHRATSAVRCSLPESEMRAVFMVVGDVFGN